MKQGLIAAAVLQDLFGIFCITLVLKSAQQLKQRSKRRSAAVFIVSALVSTVYSSLLFSSYFSDISQGFEDTATIIGFLSTLLIVLSSHLILKSKNLLRTILISLAVISVSEIVFGLFSVATGVNMNTEKGFLIEEIITAFSYAIISILLLSAVRNKELSTVRTVIDSLPGWMYILAVLFSFTAFCTSGLTSGFEGNPVFEKANKIVFVITAVGVMLGVGYFFYKILKLSIQQTQILAQFSQQHDSYEAMIKTDDKLRQFRHDYKNHMMVVTALLSSGKTDEAADYLRKVQVISGVVGRLFSTGNFVADALLNYKNSFAEEYSVHLDFSGAIPEKGIENADMCTVLSNLLDNAVDAAKHFDGNRFVKIDANVRNGYLTLSVSNPVSGEVVIKNNKIKTTKNDSINHGHGLRNVERVAKEYNGNMLLSCENRCFTADLNMKLNHEKENY